MTNTRARQRARSRGFTLIELLVVIAIIAILAAILFPVFAKARDKAKQASCTSNLKQCMLAVIQYTNDYDGRMPGNTSGAGWNQWWYNKVEPYTKNTGITECPVHNAWRNPVNYGPWFDLWSWENKIIIDDTSKPAETAFLYEGECKVYNHCTGIYAPRHTNCSGPVGAGDYRTAPVKLDYMTHGTGANVGFVDGHVKLIQGNDLKENFLRWNSWN